MLNGMGRCGWLLMLTAALTLGGCGPQKPAPGGAASGATSRSMSADEQRLAAGMAAYEAGRTNEAISHLAPLASHRDARIAGRASATLGLIYLARGEHPRAISHLRPAAEKLSGDDAAQAYFHLGQAHQKLGRWAEARTWLSLTVSKASDDGLREAAKRLLASTGYTLQLGAYSTKANAEKQAVEMKAVADRASLGSPRVVPSRNPEGGTLFLVQVGRFSTFDSAMQARQKLGRNDAIVVAMSE